MFRKLRANFFTGILVVIPAVFTIWVIYFIINKLNFLLLEPITAILENWIQVTNIEVLIKALIFLLLVIFLTIVGFATRVLILRNIFGFGETILYRVPMISTLYRTIKDISAVFLNRKNKIFHRVVLVEYPRKGNYQLGFVTSEAKSEVQEKTKENVLNIFVPTTPNPTTGILMFIPEEDTISLDMSVTDGMKMVMSGGAVVPKQND